MANRIKTVEDAVFAYLETLLAGDRGDIGEFPRAAESTTVSHWMFAITGGTEMLLVEKDKQTYAWVMAATFRGIYTSRESAFDDLWTVMDDLPINSTDVASVQRVDASAPPTIARQVVQLENDLASGGDTRIWAVELPLEITFERS
jgi:hypothetical protein